MATETKGMTTSELVWFSFLILALIVHGVKTKREIRHHRHVGDSVVVEVPK